MNSLPFSMASDESAWIVEKLRMCENEGDMVGLLPVLYFVLNETCTDKEGRVIEWLPDPFFDIFWETPENVANGSYVEIDVLGRKLFCPSQCLEKLEGKRLVLETVEVGFPTPGEVKRQVLRAVRNEP